MPINTKPTRIKSSNQFKKIYNSCAFKSICIINKDFPITKSKTEDPSTKSTTKIQKAHRFSNNCLFTNQITTHINPKPTRTNLLITLKGLVIHVPANLCVINKDFPIFKSKIKNPSTKITLKVQKV